MTVAPIVPDSALASQTPTISAIPAPASSSTGRSLTGANDPADLFTGLVHAFGQGDRAFADAQRAEDDVVAGRGDIQTMIFERARADALLQIASGAAGHLTQSLNTILSMQV